MSMYLLWKSLILEKLKQKGKQNRRKLIIRGRAKTGSDTGFSTCRVCGKHEATIFIFNNVKGQSNLATEIQNFSGIRISPSDKFPKHICHGCLDLLKKCILFRNTCQQTNKAFKGSTLNAYLSKTKRDQNDVSSKNERTQYATVKTERLDSLSENDDTAIWNCSTEFDNGSSQLDFNMTFDDKPSKSDQDNSLQGPSSVKKQKVKRKRKINNFLCDTCGKAFIRKQCLSEHINTHNNVFPYKCDVCPYQGQNVSLLRVHQRSHLIDKPCKCTQCPFATTTASNLSSHMRRSHSDERPFKCTTCEKTFKMKSLLKQHCDRLHLNLHTTECEICSKVVTKQKLANHLWKLHKIKTEKSGLPNRLPTYILATRHNEVGKSQVNQNNYVESN